MKCALLQVAGMVFVLVISAAFWSYQLNYKIPLKVEQFNQRQEELPLVTQYTIDSLNRLHIWGVGMILVIPAFMLVVTKGRDFRMRSINAWILFLIPIILFTTGLVIPSMESK